MKAKTLLVAAVMFFGLSAAAFAQGTFSVGSIPVTTVTATGYTEGAGAITFTLIQNSAATVNGTITINYQVPITSALSGVTISQTPAPTVGVDDVTVLPGASSNSSGVLVLSVPANLAATTSFTVRGVRVAVYGSGLSELRASISSVGNAIVAGQANVVVISAISNGIAAVTSTQASINAVTGAVTGTAAMKVKENYLNAFADSSYSQLATGLGVWVRFTLTSAPPAGVTLTFPATATTNSTGVFTLVDSAGAATTKSITSSSSSLAAYYKLTSDSDPALIETLTVPVTITTSTSSLPLSQASVTFTATLAPIGTAFDADGNVITPADGKAPRFAALEVGPATLLTISGSSTAMLVPFASTVSASGYNTGLAVANSTSDPGTTALGGITSAVKQAGKIVFYFYPQQVGSTAPTTFSYTTAAGSPGTGLDANGNLPSGSTYSVLLSQLLTAAAAPADFSGYIFIITQFTNGHCQYIITDFKAFANGGQAMIIASDRSLTPESLSH